MNPSATEVDCYVLRHTAFSLAVKPTANDEVFEIKAYDPDGDTYDCTYIETDESGNLIYHVTQNGSSVLSRMNRNLVFEVYFVDRRTEGMLIIENRDYITGDLLENTGEVRLTVTNPLYSAPAKNLSDDVSVGGTINVQGSSAAYSIITGTITRLNVNGQSGYRLHCYTKQIDDGEILTYSIAKKVNSFNIEVNITENTTIKIVNYYLKAAFVTEKALYGENDGEYTQMRPDLRNSQAYNSISLSCTAQKGDEVIANDSLSTGYENSGAFLTGESATFNLVITELAGYTLNTLTLGCNDVGSWTLTRDQITSEPVPPSGNHVLSVNFDEITQGSLDNEQFALFKETFSSLKGLKSYSVEATFTADIIHINAYEMNLDDFLIMEELGLYEYRRRYNTMEFHSPRRVANVGNYSIDGSINDIYYSNNYLANEEIYDIGVRRNSRPICTVNYQYRVETRNYSSIYEHFRVGAVYYGDSEASQRKQPLGEQVPLPVGTGADIPLDPISGDSYLTVIYVLTTVNDIRVPEVREETYSSTDTVIKNTRLSVNLYCYNEETDGYEPITDEAMLNEIGATLQVQQTCVGYHEESSSNSAKESDEHHHANYVPDNPGELPIVYHHDNLPVLYRYNWEEDRFDTAVEALIADEMDGITHPTGSTTKQSTVPMNAPNLLYAVKYNNIDRVHVSLDANIPETYNLQKLEINSNGTIITRNDSCAFDYWTADGSNVTVSYYFGRPILEVGTNNDTSAPKGSVRLNDAIVIKDTDYMQAMSFHAGDPIVLVIEPNEGYEFDYIRAGSSRSGDMAYVPADKISQSVNADGKTITTVNLGICNRNVYVQLQFRGEVQEDLSLLTVNQFLINSSGEAIPIRYGEVVIIGTGNGAEETLRVGDTRTNRLTLTDAESLSANVLAGTRLDFTLNAPDGYDLAASPFEASYQEKNNNTSNSIFPEHNDNSRIYTVPLSYVENERAITVNVYFSPRYRLIYDGNGHTGGEPPTESKTYASLQTEDHLKDRNTLTRTGFDFGGWSLNKNETEPVTSVTFADEDITLYAIWLPKSTYTVTYHSEGHTGSVPVDPDSPYYAGDTVHVLDKGDLARGAYTFSGWDTDVSADTVVYIPFDSNSPQSNSYFTIDHDTDLYAVWTAPEYTVTYDGNGATQGDAPTDPNSPYTLGSEVTVLGQGDLDKTGYTFLGWSLTPGENNYVDYAEGGSFSIDGDAILYAVWQINTYHVYYSLTVPDDVNFTFETDQSFVYGADVSMQSKPDPSAYTVPGKYSFDGWNNSDTDLQMNAAGTAFVMPAHNVTFTGSFSVNGQSNLIYNANGGLPADKVPASQSVYGALSTTVENMPADCVRTGYEFDHWNTKADDSGATYQVGDAIEVPENTTTVLYAQWGILSFHVEYYDIDGYSEGKQPLKSDVYAYNQSVTVGAQAPALDGKKFRQWELVQNSQRDADGTAIEERTTFPMPAETVRYKAVYDNLQYQVQYVYTGTKPADAPELPTDTSLYAFGSEVIVKPVPSAPSGYRFDGWKLGGSNTTGFTINVSTPVTPVGGNELLYTITLTGVWGRENEVNITYTSGLSGNDITDESLRTVKTDVCIKGQDYTLRHNERFTDYVRPGYEFVGWKITASGSQSSPMGYYLMTFLHSFAPKLFGDDDTVYEEGAVIEALGKDITLAAVWQQNSAPTYTVTYHGNENTSGNPPTDDGQYAAGSSATVLGRNTLQKTGYEFDGWTTEPDGGDHYNQGDTLTVNGNVNLYAKWKASDDHPDEPQTTYRVFYDGNGATSGNVPEDHNEYLRDSEVTVLSQGNLKKEGYTFAGWNTQADGKGKTYKPGEKFTIGGANVTLYAVWNPKATTHSPGTGESALPLATAFSAMILSAIAVAAIIMRRRRRA